MAAALHHESRQESLWGTPLGFHTLADAAELNTLLSRIFGALRASQLQARAEVRQQAGTAPLGPAPVTPAFFASDDDLLVRVKLPEWEVFVRFIVESLRSTVTLANRHVWPPAGIDLRVAIDGMWFQCSNHGAFHDVHTHGNCSWSGVYVVQVDDEARRIDHPVHGESNGCTRFYGPHFTALAGGYADLGNAYLQPPHIEVPPVPGRLVLFPSGLPHQAMPYSGDKERIVVSFNASIHADNGDRLHGYSAR